MKVKYQKTNLNEPLLTQRTLRKAIVEILPTP